MEAATKQFKQSAAETLSDARIQDSLRGLYSGFSKARERAGEADAGLGGDAHPRAGGQDAHDRQPGLLPGAGRGEGSTESGGNVFFARDGEAASRYILDLVEREGVRRVIKGKSMLSEEMDLNSQLVAAGVEATETDLGEYLIQLAGDTPYHIIAPAIHMSKEQAAELLRRDAGAGDMGGDITELTAEARRQLRDKFIEADMGITGANFVAADTGTLVLVTNEGNGRMCTSDAPDTRRYHGDGEGGAVAGGHGDVPAAAHPLCDRPAAFDLRDHGRRAQTVRRRGRPGAVPPGHRGQRALPDTGGPSHAGGAELHPVRGVPERLPGVPEGRGARVRLGVLGAHRRDLDADDDGRAGLARPAARVEPVRGVPGGVPSADRHPAHAAAPAAGACRGARRPAEQEDEPRRGGAGEGVEAVGVQCRDAGGGQPHRQGDAVAAAAPWEAAAAAAAAVRVGAAQGAAAHGIVVQGEVEADSPRLTRALR